MRIESLEPSEWKETLPNEGLEPFHTSEALGVIDQHTTGELHFLGGFKSEQLVGLLPVLERSKFGARLLTSPPVGFGISRLGPVVMPASPKQRKREATNRKFIRAVIENLDAENSRTLLRFACTPTYNDPRPFQWDGFKTTPAFTYRINLNDRDKEELLNSFTRSLRREIRKREDVDITIRKGNINDARRTYKSITERYREQNIRVPFSWEFFRDLIRALEDRIRVYVAETSDRKFLSGMIILYSNDTAYFWKGGAKTERTVSPNSLLHWRVLEDILTEPALEPIQQYDFNTANNERLTKSKSSFGGEPTPYYVIESNGPAMSVVKGIYRMKELRKNPLGRKGEL